MIEVTIINAFKCLSCGVFEEEMTKIGPMIFCRTCAWKIFDINSKTSEVLADTAEYKKWITKYKEG